MCDASFSQSFVVDWFGDEYRMGPLGYGEWTFGSDNPIKHPLHNLNRTGDSSDLRKVENKKIIRETENVGFELNSLLIHLKIESRPK